jgi:spore germination protein GerM
MEETVKRFHLLSYLILLICLAGFACTPATNNNTSNAKAEATPTAATPATTPSPASGSGTTPTAATTQQIKVYLVAVNDNGKKGKKIGCDDSLVAVTRTIPSTQAPLKAALEELLAIPHEYNKELGNYWWGKDLKLKSVSITGAVATIHISGEGPYVAGICDEPRITEQIEETAKQFPTVKKVEVFVNGKPLKEAIR